MQNSGIQFEWKNHEPRSAMSARAFQAYAKRSKVHLAQTLEARVGIERRKELRYKGMCVLSVENSTQIGLTPTKLWLTFR